MRSGKFSLVLGTIAAILFVGLCSAGFVRQQRLTDLEAQTRQELQKLYDSQGKGFVNSAFSDGNSKTIDQFTLQGNIATAWVRWHYRGPGFIVQTQKHCKEEFVALERERWRKGGIGWILVSTIQTRCDGVQDDKPFHTNCGTRCADEDYIAPSA